MNFKSYKGNAHTNTSKSYGAFQVIVHNFFNTTSFTRWTPPIRNCMKFIIDWQTPVLLKVMKTSPHRQCNPLTWKLGVFNYVKL
jgi:hypothetical protein